MKSFAEENKIALEGKSTAEVCEEIIRPATKQNKCSYTQLLKETEKNENVSLANVFVSHVWQCNFLVLLETLFEWCVQNKIECKTCFLWIDAFVFNQHIEIKDYKYWTVATKKVLQAAGKAVIVLPTWNRPLWAYRIWCLFEFWAMFVTNVSVDVLLHSKESASLLEYLMNGGKYEEIFGKVDVRAAMASKKRDEKGLKEQILASSSADNLNEAVTNRLRKWLLQVAEEALNHIEPETDRNGSGLHYDVAVMYESQGQFEKAAEMLELSLRTQSTHVSNQMRADIQYHLGCCCLKLGKLRDAQTALAEAAELARATPGSDTRVANALEKLGQALSAQGQYEASLTDLGEALALKRKIFGPSHAQVADTLLVVGDVLRQQGQHGQALAEYEQALKIQMISLGKAHPGLARTRECIGTAALQLGKVDEALKEFTEVLQIRKAALGEFHPETAVAHDNIASVYHKQGKYDLALSKYSTALQIRRTALGENHPETALAHNNLGGVYHRLGKQDQALTEYGAALQIQRTVLGWRHADTALTCSNIGVVYCAQGKYTQALAEYEKALEIRMAVLGEEHASTAMTLVNMAALYHRQGEAQRARAEYERALQIQLAVLGEDHVDTATTRDNLGIVLWKQGHDELALIEHEKALAVRRALLGDKHPDVATTLGNIGCVLHRQGKHEEALARYGEALQIQKVALGDRAVTHSNMGVVYADQDRHDLAVAEYTTALQLRQALYGNCSASVAETRQSIGYSLKAMGQNAKAKEMLVEAARTYTSLYGPDDIRAKDATSYASRLAPVKPSDGTHRCGQCVTS